MEHKIIKIMIRIAHISEKLQSLSTELDTLYELLGDKELLTLLDAKFNNQLTIEEYE